MNDNYYKQLMEDSPIGYAYHRIINDDEAIPCEYELIEGNAAFEKITGLNRSDMLGRRVPRIVTGIKWSEINWVELYENIEINEDKREFEQFSKPLNKWYRVNVHSPEKNYLMTHFIDISKEKGQSNELKNLDEEKEKRAAELVIANKELVIQNEEKDKKAAELVIANKELAFQNEEKADRAAELVIANKELTFQNEEKEKRAAELILANAYLENLINYANAPIIVLDPQLHITRFNHAVAFIIGRSEKEVLGKSLDMLFPPEQANKSMKLFKNLQKEKRWETLEIEIIHVDGSIRTLLWNSAIIYDSDGITPVSIIAQGQDLTDRKKAEEASNAKSQFLANMSHEIRTPMNAIMGLTYLLDQSDLDDSQKKYVSKIKAASTVLLKIINDILDFSKIEAGKLEIENIKFNIDMILENVSNLYTMTATNKGIDINFDTGESVPDLLIGDPHRLEQIISNLTTNAIKFTNQGEVNVVVRSIEETEDKVKLHFSVTDTGIGLTKDQIKILFTAFTQADDSMTRKYGGTGLGLKISKQLVELMNGKIWVESVYGEGAYFHFIVQFDKAVDLIKLNYEEYSDFQGKKVLVVDHNKTSLMMLERMLRSFSFEVTALRNPFEAIELLQQEDFDLLVIDFNLPELSGINLYKRLVANTEITVPKTIFVSATGRESYYNQVSQLGVNNFLVKPINQSLMFDAVMNALKGTAWSQANKDLNEERRIKYPSALKDKRILLVEDNDINQLVAKDILEQVGIHVSIASNGEEAIEYVRANKFDAVLMDVQMPIMDGYKATEIIRKSYSSWELPIIAMTANALKGDRERSLEPGMNDYISKPINPELLFETLAKWLLGISIKSLEKPSSEKVEILDFEKTLIQLGNKQDFYFDLLKRYSDNYSNLVKELLDMRLNRQYTEAKRFIHSLKSVTGNIGALKLSRFIVEFEENYESYNEKSLAEKFKELSNLNEELLSTITNIIPITDPEKKLLDFNSNFDVYEALGKLRDALEKARANEIKESLSYLVSNAQDMRFMDKINVTKKLVNRYRYKDAKAMVEEIMDIVKESYNG